MNRDKMHFFILRRYVELIDGSAFKQGSFKVVLTTHQARRIFGALEAYLNVDLYIRPATHFLALTPAGQHAYRKARTLLFHIDDLMATPGRYRVNGQAKKPTTGSHVPTIEDSRRTLEADVESELSTTCA